MSLVSALLRQDSLSVLLALFFSGKKRLKKSHLKKEKRVMYRQDTLSGLSRAPARTKSTNEQL